MDIEVYNYVDIVLRKLRMNKLADEVNRKSTSLNNEEDDQAAANANNEGNQEDDDDETKKIVGIWAIPIGPDGGPLKRNNSDVMNNFYI
jgi:hypothetical protein